MKINNFGHKSLKIKLRQVVGTSKKVPTLINHFLLFSFPHNVNMIAIICSHLIFISTIFAPLVILYLVFDFQSMCFKVYILYSVRRRKFKPSRSRRVINQKLLFSREALQYWKNDNHIESTLSMRFLIYSTIVAYATLNIWLNEGP